MEKPVAVRMIETIQYYIIIAKVVRVPVPLPPGTGTSGYQPFRLSIPSGLAKTRSFRLRVP